MHIVVAIGDDKNGHHALEWALENVIKPDTHLTILTIVEPPVQLGYYFAANAAMYTPDFVDQITKAAEDQATSLVRKLRALVKERFAHLSVEMVVGKGEVKNEIVDYCNDKWKQDKNMMLVLSSRGLGQVKRVLLGSTSDYCAHHCTCPVLIVK